MAAIRWHGPAGRVLLKEAIFGALTKLRHIHGRRLVVSTGIGAWELPRDVMGGLAETTLKKASSAAKRGSEFANRNS
ncbi:hypothetical protein VTN77DRAFT_3160 [Rasamsonia byssochlamydoides]|uniref:uncharacterized protein n=1 Tax=Rasamsonia byssochlamydoides TaxID=89139 RepID=UPI0037436013